MIDFWPQQGSELRRVHALATDPDNIPFLQQQIRLAFMHGASTHHAFNADPRQIVLDCGDGSGNGSTRSGKDVRAGHDAGVRRHDVVVPPLAFSEFGFQLPGRLLEIHAEQQRRDGADKQNQAYRAE